MPRYFLVLFFRLFDLEKDEAAEGRTRRLITLIFAGRRERRRHGRDSSGASFRLRGAGRP
jgi:hypothetical protein